MNTKHLIYIFLAILSVIGIVLLVNELAKTKKEIKTVKGDLQNLLQYQIEESQKPNKLIESLVNLIAFFKGKDDDICAELEDVLKRIKSGDEAEAARVITLVVENVLKEKAKEELNEWYINFKKPEYIKLNHLIDKFKSIGFLNEEEFQLASMIKNFRNEKSHQLNIEGKTPYNVKMLNVHVGIILLDKCTTT